MTPVDKIVIDLALASSIKNTHIGREAAGRRPRQPGQGRKAAAITNSPSGRPSHLIFPR